MEVRPGYKRTEVGVIPEEWEVKPLKGRIGISHGFAFASQHFSSHGPYRLTTPAHFYEAGGFRDIGEKQKYYVGPVLSDYVLQPGTVIVAMTEQADGLLGSAGMIPNEYGYLHNQRLGRVTVLTPEVELAYLVHVFNSARYRSKVRETAAGTKVKHTSPEKLLEIPVRLPPPPEQRAIAAALSDADALLSGLERLIAKKRDLKHAAMQQLLTGQTRLPGFHGEWESGNLASVIVALETGVSVNSVEDNDPGSFDGMFILKTSAVAGGRFMPRECKRIALRDLSRACLNPLKDTIIISRMNTPDLVGECGYVDRDYPNLFVPDRLWMTRFKQNLHLSARWLSYLLSSAALKRQIGAAATGTSGSMKNLSKQAFMEIPIALPSGPEQSAIAAVLSDMDAELSALEAHRDKTRALKQGMMQELLTGKTRLVAAGSAHG